MIFEKILTNKNLLNMTDKKTKIFNKKPLILLTALFFTAFGIAVAAFANSITSSKKTDVFEEAFSFHDKFFKEMVESEKRMNRLFFEEQESLQKAFEHEKSASKTKISNRQDDENYYYELYFSDFKKDDIVVAIKDGNLSFFANKNDEKSQSNFYYSFSAPNYDSAKAPEISRQENLILVKLAKKK